MKIRTIGAAALLVGMSLPLGCGAEDGGDPLGEELATETEGLQLFPATFNPSRCTLSAYTCTSCDSATGSCMNMHCCPTGQAMTGVNLGENTFQCRGVVGASTDMNCRLVANNSVPNTRFINGVNIRACPVGSYMKGLHAGNNAITCCDYPSSNRSTMWWFDGVNQESHTQVLAPRIKHPPWPWAGVCGDAYVHACPFESVMEGYSIGNNWNLCGQ